MKCKLIIFLACCAAIFMAAPTYAQVQACPVNINFAQRDLTSWSAQTGIFNGGRNDYPGSNAGTSVIPEYQLSIDGIKIITQSYNDLYGSFATIPVINGYAYKYSILLGSTATSYDLTGGGI